MRERRDPRLFSSTHLAARTTSPRVGSPLAGTPFAKGRTSMGKRGRLILIFGLLLVTVLVVSVPAFAQDPFAGLTSTLNSNARTWAAALMLVGALIAGGAIMMGSHESGRHARN